MTKYRKCGYRRRVIVVIGIDDDDDDFVCFFPLIFMPTPRSSEASVSKWPQENVSVGTDAVRRAPKPSLPWLSPPTPLLSYRWAANNFAVRRRARPSAHHSYLDNINTVIRRQAFGVELSHRQWEGYMEWQRDVAGLDVWRNVARRNRECPSGRKIKPASQPTICTSNFRKTFQVVDADLVFLDPVGSSVFRRVARCSVYCVSAFLRFYIRVRKCELWLAIRGRPQRHNRGRT